MIPTIVLTSNFLQDVIAVADHLGMKVFTFAGFSMGGAVGKLLAIDYPQRLARYRFEGRRRGLKTQVK